MSSSKASRKYHCSNDCRRGCLKEGCPGHFIELIYNHSSDTVSIKEDSKDLHTYDKMQWRVLVNLDEEIRGKS